MDDTSQDLEKLNYLFKALHHVFSPMILFGRWQLFLICQFQGALKPQVFRNPPFFVDMNEAGSPVETKLWMLKSLSWNGTDPSSTAD